MQKKDRDIVAKTIGKLLKKELEFAAASTGSMFAYQPVVPKGLEKFEKKC